MESLEKKGLQTVDGGGGGNFFRSAMVRWKVKAIHLHWLHPYIIRNGRLGSIVRGMRLVFELWLLKLSGKKIVWTIHNLHNHQDNHRDIERFVCRWVAWLADALLCHSNFAAEAVSKEYRVASTKITVSPHPIWGGDITKSGQADALQSEALRGRSSCVFLFFGRVAPYKGIEKLIDSFGRIDRRDIKLLICGGPQSEEYEAQVRLLAESDDRIELTLRFIDDDEIPHLFRASDFVVFPFTEILTSGSILLAMEFAKPCIAPAIGSIPEILPSEQLDLTYDPREAGALERKLRFALQLGVERVEIGNKNFCQAKDWTWEQLADDCIQLYGMDDVSR